MAIRESAIQHGPDCRRLYDERGDFSGFTQVPLFIRGRDAHGEQFWSSLRLLISAR